MLPAKAEVTGREDDQVSRGLSFAGMHAAASAFDAARLMSL
jgi:hypothetical protein